VTKIPKIKLGKIAKFQQGLQVDVDCQFYSKEENYVQFLRIVDYTNNEEKPRFIEQVKDSPSFVNNNDVVMIRYGSQTAGKVVIGKEGIIANNMFRIIPTINEIEKRYLYYFLKNQTIYNFLMNGQSSSTMPAITFGMMYDVDILLPEIVVQQKIASILSALDSKIELNNSINTELEAMAKTLYDYWFVQFDFPDENGKPYKTSGGKMVWNEELKREIPEGWEVKLLGDLGNFKNGVNYDPSNPGEIACPIINVRNISASSYFLKNEDLDIIYLKESDVRKYAVHEGSIIIARSGIPGATRLISDIAENTLYCGFAIHYELKNLKNKIPIFFYLKSIEQQIQNGSGGTILKNVNQGTLNALLFALPIDNSITIRFNELIQPIFSKINLIQLENQKLTELRDWLLPMLMNGQVKVN
jgi:type I restriction enzyme S subunit